MVDLHPVTRDNYYHPDMLGSWSIKAMVRLVGFLGRTKKRKNPTH
jgi:hypothetical protein